MDRKKIGIILIALAAVISYAYVYSLTITQRVTQVELPEGNSVRVNPWSDGQFSDADEHCLALNVYFEARGERNTRGKYAVADVVMYRYLNSRYPNAVCDIVQQGRYSSWNDHPIRHKCQFSWWCDGKEDIPKNTKAFEEAVDIAQEVLYDDDYVPKIEYAIHYHAKHVRPQWSRKKEFVERIGNHLFYR